MTICRTKRQFFSPFSVFWHFSPGGINGPIILLASLASAEPVWGCSGACLPSSGFAKSLGALQWHPAGLEWNLSAPASSLGTASQIPEPLKVFRYLIPTAFIGSWGLNATQKVPRQEEPDGTFAEGQTQHLQVDEKQNSRESAYVMDHSSKKNFWLLAWWCQSTGQFPHPAMLVLMNYSHPLMGSVGKCPGFLLGQS